MLKPRPLLARRRLIVTFLVLAVLVSVGYLNNRTATIAQVANGPAIVGIAKTPNLDPTPAEIEAAVRQAIELAGGLPDTIGPGKKIVIQPNLVEAGWYSGQGVTPNISVIRTVVEMCLEKGATASNITICEGSANFRDGSDHGIYDSRSMTRKAFVDVGLDTNRDMIEDIYGVKLVDANNVGGLYSEYPGYSGPYNSNYVTKVNLPSPMINRVYVIPNCVAQCDVLIRIPVLKTHNLAGVTGSLKLAFGIAPSDVYHAFGDGYKWNLLHNQAWGYNELETNARGMVDMTMARIPDFVICDGLVGVTNGPTGEGGVLKYPTAGKMGCILAGANVVAVDTIETLACGYDVNSIAGINAAVSKGLGTNDVSQIQVNGVHVAEIRRWFPNYGCARGGDQGAPYMSGLNVADGAHVSSSLYVRPISYTDSGSGVAKAELYVDGVLADISTASSTAYATVWSIGKSVPQGQHTIKYTMYDKMLNETSFSRTVYVHSGDPVMGALSAPDGASVNVGTVYMAGRAPAIDTQTFFVVSADGLHGLRVSNSAGALTFANGYELQLTGTMTTVNGQRVLNLSSHVSGSAKSLAAPRLFRNSAIGGASVNGSTPGVSNGTGPYNLGCLVRVVGKVVAGGTNYFYIDDGSYKLKVLSGSFSQPTPGKHVSLTGFSCTEGGNRLFVWRSSSDINTYN